MAAAKRWIKKSCDEAFADLLVKELRISPLLASLLSMRKIKSLEEAHHFLNPSLKSLTDPLAFSSMKEGLERIAEAIIQGEHIGLFGDYDVDGVCSTAILEQFLHSIGANVVSTLPNRLKEGYGLSIAGVDRLKEAKATLLITLDCGALAHSQIEYANNLLLDVIVVDHHTMGATLPQAFATINPKRHDCASDASYLCAAGVTFFLILGLRRALRERGFFATRPEPDVRELLDLVALATVCDVVPLVKHNRSLVKAGLKAIKVGQRVGLKALLNICGIDPAKISSTNLGFHLGPRINAAGRLEDATLALRLLGASDMPEAEHCASLLHSINEERKALEQQTVEEAEAMAQAYIELPQALVLHDERWHPGVVGIVASRIAERFHRPSIIIGENGKGSGRSIKGIDLHAMVEKASSTLIGFGGHSHAIGLHLGPQGAAAFRESLNAIIAEHTPQEIFHKELFYDALLNLNEATIGLAEELKMLEPFGAQNPYPIMRFDRCFMRNLRELSFGHLKGELESCNAKASFIAFRTAIPDELASKALDILAVVEKNEWQGRLNVQLRLVDYMISTT